MSTEFAVAPPEPTVAAASAGVAHGSIVQRDGAVYADPMSGGAVLLADIDRLIQSGRYFTGLDYAVLMRLLYGVGPELARMAGADTLVPFATGIASFDPARRGLYRDPRIRDGVADYTFEPVFAYSATSPGQPAPARLDIDEFVAHLWGKGVRFGIDLGAVRAALASEGAAGLVLVASRLAPAPGVDAQIVEVSSDLHRSDAPRQMANGKLDLMSFQNRFPQIKPGMRLLKKQPAQPGTRGLELSGAPIAAPVPADVELGPMAGSGTLVERTGGGEFLVAQRPGFLNVDPATQQISIDAKIISRDGVSSRTTGNLQLTGDYEEFGEVQEMRVIEGEGITIHADVFGKIISRGGLVLLNRNLVGGSATNKRGDITIEGVASGAVIQAKDGTVTLQRAENCVISGTRVRVGHAVNCEIIGNEVSVGQAEGCALAGRQVTVESSAPRRDSEMLVLALWPDCAKIDEVIAQVGVRVQQFAERAAQCKAEVERMTGEPEVRRYVTLASKVRKNEITLTAEQLPTFQQMAIAVGPQLKAIGKVSLDAKAAETEQQAGQALIDKLIQQRTDSNLVSSVKIGELRGDTQVRTLPFSPDGSRAYDLSPRDIKTRLRTAALSALLYGGSSGAFDWTSAT
ncbi:flagellar assembly protein A [Massilia sp. S19_KUP03_FR1]|uniref:flagellar assembly protein A n=1 Tax=Massilia sp. S19_KUP03_FR1 TaxID=3025503 RepID=UPI002FCD8E07